jgi:hypothetical protein
MLEPSSSLMFSPKKAGSKLVATMWSSPHYHLIAFFFRACVWRPRAMHPTLSSSGGLACVKLYMYKSKGHSAAGHLPSCCFPVALSPQEKVIFFVHIWICISCYFMDQASIGCHPEFQRMCSMRFSSLLPSLSGGCVSLWLRLQFFIIHPPYKFMSEVNALSAGHFCVISDKRDPTPVCIPSFPSMTAHPS